MSVRANSDSLFVLFFVLKKNNKKVSRLCELFYTSSLNGILLCSVLMIIGNECARCTKILDKEAKYLFFGQTLCEDCNNAVENDESFMSVLNRIYDLESIYARQDRKHQNYLDRKE